MDPFGSASDSLWGTVKDWSQLAYTLLTEPDKLFQSNQLASSIFASSWPLANYLAILCFITLVCWISFGGYQSAQHLVRAFLATVLTGASGAAIWIVNVRALEGSQQLAKKYLWDASTNTVSSDPIFPSIGSGFLPMLVYLFYLGILAVVLLFLFAIVGGQGIIGGVVVVGIGLIGLGEYGRKIGQWSMTIWIACFLVGLQIFTLSLNWARTLSKTTSDQNAAIFLSVVAVILGFVLLGLVFTLFYVVTSRVTQGFTRSRVHGDTDSNITNDPDVHNHDDIQAPIPVDVNVSSDPSVAIDEITVDQNGGSMTSGSITIATSSEPEEITLDVEEPVSGPQTPEDAYVQYMRGAGWIS